MGVHASGDGDGWVETSPDVDQPHGLDYRELQDIRKGVRKRIAQEHTTFTDSTVGGIHKPGGVAVLGMEITDDCTVAVVADGTYRGHGIVWSLSDTSNWGVLFCTTGAAGASAAGDIDDWTVMRIHPDLQWGGGDITWAGAQEFDGTVDFTATVNFDGSVDMSDVYVSGDLTVKGDLKVATDFSLTGDMAVDGTSNLTGDVAVGADLSVTGYIKTDATTTEFGETAGIGLFYDPTVYAGGETSTLGNGLIIKMGKVTLGANTTTDISFATAMPNASVSGIATIRSGAAGLGNTTVASCDITATGVTVTNDDDAAGHDVYWVVIGY